MTTIVHSIYVPPLEYSGSIFYVLSSLQYTVYMIAFNGRYNECSHANRRNT